jgi:hypothetical protein
MKTLRWFCVAALAVVLAVPSTRAQEPPKPGPEHEYLKKMEGNWDLTMKFGDMEDKGTVTYKMELGGLGKFYGKGLDTYDPATKKFVSYFFNSMGTRPVAMEGTYDKEKKVLTLAGEAPGPDGTPMKYKSTSEMPDDNTIKFTMWMGDAKDPGFTITYKRKK